MVALSLLAAERHRLRHGAGQLVELSLKDVGAAMLGNLGIIGEVAVNGVDRPKGGNALYGAYGQDFTCACGGRVMVIGLTDRQWRGLVKVTDTSGAMAALAARLGVDLADEGARYRARSEITEILKPWFAARRIADFADIFEASGITWSEFRSFAEAVRLDPDLSEQNPMFRVIDQPGIGPYPVPGSPLSFSALPRADPAPAPVLGQHTEDILADVLGLGTGQSGAVFSVRLLTEPQAPAAVNTRDGRPGSDGSALP
jgi:2-methylfumaryl-CoA isomerase